MDIDLRRDGEYFSTFDSLNFLGPHEDPFRDEGTTTDSVQSFDQNDYGWNSEREQEINGDISLVPVCDVNITNDTSPQVDDFLKILNNWHHYINIDPNVDLTLEQYINTKDNESDIAIEKEDILNTSNFDITKYLNDEEPAQAPEPSKPPIKKQKAGVKKIDLQAQKYIIDEEDYVDVETVSECEENMPVLEAKDLKSLLEQFEATQIPLLSDSFIKSEPIISESIPSQIFEEPEIKKEVKIEQIQCSANVKQEIIKVETPTVKQEVLHSDNDYKCEKRKENEKHKNKINNKKKQKDLSNEKSKINDNKIPVVEIKEEKTSSSSSVKRSSKLCSTPKNVAPSCKSQVTADNSKPQLPLQNTKIVPLSTETTPNKQIADSLPPELIARIKESGKRKTISVIDPIPTRKRGCPRIETNSQPPRKKICQPVMISSVQLDHSYCNTGLMEPYPKVPMKDSGFESTEEDDRPVIGTQPTVKNADGKLMVSLLKANTILPNNANQKKKLNLEEYKKRREGFIKSQNNSQNCSPSNSTCNSPLPEDENTRLLKHQEKLRRMALEVLNAAPKKEKKTEPIVFVERPQPKQVPAGIERKTFVSIGVNTDFKVDNTRIDPLAPVERLDEIKPLLQKVGDKINCNSLITSVIENIPKVIDSCDPIHRSVSTGKGDVEHGEDKEIRFLNKDRELKEKCSIGCQTNISLIQQTKDNRYRRRRQDSYSSNSSWTSDDSRASSGVPRRYDRTRDLNESRYSSSKSSRSSKSSSSTYSSRSSSRSLSPSASPKYSRREKERLKEVEERRVIYVGRVISGTTKEDLRKRFQRFGPITNISLHSRDHCSHLDNYGFVTFANKLDAYEAIEHGNDAPWQPKYDLSFGGRRIFCQTTYSDLDNVRDEYNGYYSSRRGATEDSYDRLLREFQEKMRKRRA